jgi:hypothetical protein
MTMPPDHSRGDIMGGLVPAPVHASPADMQRPPLDALAPEFMTMFDPETPWWRPGAADIAKTIGWRWVIVLPLTALVIALPMLAVMAPTRVQPQLISSEIKILSLSIGGVVSIVMWAIRNVVKERKDEFCIHCGYCVEGLGESGQCPECGRSFHLKLIAEYKKDPHFFVDRWRALRDAPKATPFLAGVGPTPDDGTR